MPFRRTRGRPTLSIDAEKAGLRFELAARRAAATDPDAGARLAAMFPDALVPAPGTVVSGYVRFRSEIDPAPLMARLAHADCQLALPRTPADRGGGLTFHLWRLGDPMIRSSFGVLEPSEDAAPVMPDIVLAPLLGFDRRGGRIGYGKGHYDRTLAALRALKPLAVVGLAYAVQEVDAVPADPSDQRLDWILTPEFCVPAAG